MKLRKEFYIPDDIKSVVFTDEIVPVGIKLTDMSEKQDNSVVGWIENSVWKVSTQKTGIKVLANEDCSKMFFYKENLRHICFDNFDTSKVTNMKGMFQYCYNLTSLNLNNFDTSKVFDISKMFFNCSKLTFLDLTNFNTRNVTDMNKMFCHCRNLKSLDLNNFKAILNNDEIFNNCVELERIKYKDHFYTRADFEGYKIL